MKLSTLHMKEEKIEKPGVHDESGVEEKKSKQKFLVSISTLGASKVFTI